MSASKNVNDAREFIEDSRRPKWERAVTIIEARAWLHGFAYGVGASTGIVGIVLIAINLMR